MSTTLSMDSSSEIKYLGCGASGRFASHPEARALVLKFVFGVCPDCDPDNKCTACDGPFQPHGDEACNPESDYGCPRCSPDGDIYCFSGCGLVIFSREDSFDDSLPTFPFTFVAPCHSGDPFVEWLAERFECDLNL